MARPKGSTNKNGYKMTPAAYNQRVAAPMKHGERSAVMKSIVDNFGLSEEKKRVLEDQQIQLWKDMSTPAMLLMKEYSFFRTMIDAKMLAGADPTDKDIISSMKLLLDISKEVNRLTQVSADKKVDVLAKNFNNPDKEDVVYDIGDDDAETN